MYNLEKTSFVNGKPQNLGPFGLKVGLLVIGSLKLPESRHP